LSFDRSSGQLAMRSFYSEGFVHVHRCGEPVGDGRLVFEAAQVEGGPPGMRARDTIVLVVPDTLESTFELAMPGGDSSPTRSSGWRGQRSRGPGSPRAAKVATPELPPRAE
jgi:hypothetical protein